MPICIKIADKVKFNVKGSIKSSAGVDEPFAFTLTAKRLTAAEITARTGPGNEGNPLSDFFVELIEDWSGVKDENGNAIPYDPEALRQLFNIPGLARVTYVTYLQEVGAKEKN